MICHSPPASCSRWAIADELDCLSAQHTGHSLGRGCHFAAGVQPDQQPLCQQLEGRPALLFRLLCNMQSTFDVSNTLTISDSVCRTGEGRPRGNTGSDCLPSGGGATFACVGMCAIKRATQLMVAGSISSSSRRSCRQAWLTAGRCACVVLLNCNSGGGALPLLSPQGCCALQGQSRRCQASEPFRSSMLNAANVQHKHLFYPHLILHT